jgi:hypothetical protein
MEQPQTLEELRKEMVSTVASLDLEMGGDGRSEDAAKEVAEFEEAVREDEREKIRNDAEPCYFVPYSALAPRKKEKP